MKSMDAARVTHFKKLLEGRNSHGLTKPGEGHGTAA
jgi:hypothetical protein